MAYNESQTWYVCFASSTVSPWYAKLLHPMYRHVYLLSEVEGGVLYVDCMRHALAVSVRPGKIEEYLGNGAVLCRIVHYGMLYKPAPIRMLSCVSIALMLLGINKRIFTPRGLYKELKRAGALVIRDV